MRQRIIMAVGAALSALALGAALAGAQSPPDSIDYEWHIITTFGPLPGDVWEYPIIRTPEYSASCSIVDKPHEDGTATAYCKEDGAVYIFDPDGNGAGLTNPNVEYVPPATWIYVDVR